MASSYIRSAGIRARALISVLTYGVKRLAGLPYASLPEVARRSQVICAPGEVPAITPFFWERHLVRVRGSRTQTAEYVIKEELNRRTFQFRPVTAYWLPDVALHNGSIYSGRYRQELGSGGRWDWIGLRLSGPCAEMDHAALVSTRAGSIWWGHWVTDEVPLQMLAEAFDIPVAHNRPVGRDESAYRAMLGISEPYRYGSALFQELLVIDEFAQNPDKTRRYHVLRQRLARLPMGNERIFLSRGQSGGPRVLVNEADVVKKLEAQGFRTLDISSCNAQTLVEACRGASVVVSVEGSHTAPLLYLLRDYGSMVILNPPYRVLTTLADIGVFCGLSSGMFICEPESESTQDFHADPDEVVQFVDEVVNYSKMNKPRLERFLQNVMGMGRASY